MTFSIRAINACGQRINEWVQRKPGRLDDLRDVQGAFTEDRGNVSLLALIRLAIATLEAAIWVDDVPCIEYPEKQTRRQTPEQIRARVEARKAKKRAEEEMLARIRQKREERADL